MYKKPKSTSRFLLSRGEALPLTGTEVSVLCALLDVRNLDLVVERLSAEASPGYIVPGRQTLSNILKGLRKFLKLAKGPQDPPSIAEWRGQQHPRAMLAEREPWEQFADEKAAEQSDAADVVEEQIG